MIRPLIYGTVVAALCGTMVSAQTPKVEYLSDIPDRIEFSQQAWGVLGYDTAAYVPGVEALKMQIKDKHYTKGIGSHAPGEIIVNLDGQYSLFEAEVGVQWQSGNVGSVGFQAYVDGRKAFDSGVVHERDAARPMRIPVEGAMELRLVMNDGGDGISCDVANWAEARLTRSVHPLSRTINDCVDIGPFGRVMAWDPSRMDGVHANRLQEFPAEDVFLGTDLFPAHDGTYESAAYHDGRQCIGLQWLERRRLTRVEMEFADGQAIPSPESVEVQHWQMSAGGGSPGGSAWQGHWLPTKGTIVRDGNKLVLDMAGKDNPALLVGVLKVRWILPSSSRPAEVRRLGAFTKSRWQTADILLQTEKPMPGKFGEIELYNCNSIGSGDPIHLKWDLAKPMSLKVKYALTARWKADRSVIRLRLPSGAFGVGVDDVVKNGCVYVKDLGFFAAQEPVKCGLDAYRRKIARRETVLESVSRMPDQSFEHALATVHTPPQDLGPTMLSLACDNRKFVVERGGAIYFDDKPSVYNYIDYQWGVPYACRIDPTFGSGKSAVAERHLTDGWMPIPCMELRDGGLTYRQRTLVAPFGHEATPTELGWVSYRPLGVAEYTIRNAGSHAADASISLRFTADVESKQPATVRATSQGAAIEKSGKLIGLLSCPESLKCKIDGNSVAIVGSVPANSDARCVLYMPRWDAATADALALVPAVDTLVADTKGYWKRVMAPAMKVQVPDEVLSDVITASQMHIMLAARNGDGKSVAPWIGSINYGPLESEGHSPVRGMAFTGQEDFARRALEYYIGKYNKEGFLTTGYTIVGTGWHLWTLSEYYALTQDKDWMRRIAPEVARVCRWIMAQREKTKKLDSRGERVLEYGLMPPGAMADWEVFAPYFYANGNFYAGLNGAAHALADIGYPGAGEMIANADEFRKEIIRAFHSVQSIAPVFPLRDGTWVPEYPTHPFAPMPVDDLYPGEDFGRSWCYDVEIGAHHLVPQGVLDPNSKDVSWMMNHMEDVYFLHEGWLAYKPELVTKDWYDFGGFAKVQPYYARTAEVYAMRDDVKAFIRSYFNTLPTLLNKEDLSLWEHFHASGAWNKTHETGYFLHQTRTMLLTERGEELWLAPFVTNNWMKDGMVVAISDAPTRFGKMGYRIASHVKEGYIEATIDPPTRNAPKEIVMRLRHPEGQKMRSVTVTGAEHYSFDAAKETISVIPGAGRITIRAQY